MHTDRCQVTASVNLPFVPLMSNVSTIFKPDSCAFFGRLQPNLENAPMNIFCIQLLIHFVMAAHPPNDPFRLHFRRVAETTSFQTVDFYDFTSSSQFVSLSAAYVCTRLSHSLVLHQAPK